LFRRELKREREANLARVGHATDIPSVAARRQAELVRVGWTLQKDRSGRIKAPRRWNGSCEEILAEIDAFELGKLTELDGELSGKLVALQIERRKRIEVSQHRIQRPNNGVTGDS